LNIIGVLWNIQYLSYPSVLLWLGTKPAGAGIAFSQKLGLLYLRARIVHTLSNGDKDGMS